MKAPTTTAMVATSSAPTIKSCLVVSTRFPISSRQHVLGAELAALEPVQALRPGPQHVREVLRRDENRPPGAGAGLAAAGDLEQLPGGPRRQPVERLLQDEQRRIERQGPGQRRPAALLL